MLSHISKAMSQVFSIQTMLATTDSSRIKNTLLQHLELFGGSQNKIDELQLDVSFVHVNMKAMVKYTVQHVS
ncbi:hypothetical protein XELAEV_18029594mg [Xenopus laevis]|uniref:Uncharacterized protein n=1 Tax=Xenopus laevis TaxID=8355 RepID=A0A974HHQ2_XENLA|nr:hypothetical protein XELAEV_18029594mg [Xenopus laevis]